MESIVLGLMMVPAVYFGIGLLFGIYFVIAGAPKIDPIMKESKWGLRLLFFPGAIAMWIFLLPKLSKRS